MCETSGSYDEFLADAKTQDAILYNLIIGEAANQISDEFQERHDTIPWSSMIGTRNIIIHGYNQVKLQIVWKILQRDLPPVSDNFPGSGTSRIFRPGCLAWCRRRLDFGVEYRQVATAKSDKGAGSGLRSALRNPIECNPALRIPARDLRSAAFLSAARSVR
jgi:uncharacterized protein with HEPN domain